MNASFFALGWRTLLRDWRAGELRLLAVAVTLAVAALTSVAFFADRLNGGLQRDALQIRGGDAVVASDNATPAAFVERARALGLQTVTTLGFPTMGRATDERGGAARLVAFKSVEPGYPLRGSLKVAAVPGDAAASTRDIPAPGEVWVDAPLLDALGVRVQSCISGDGRYNDVAGAQTAAWVGVGIAVVLVSLPAAGRHEKRPDVDFPPRVVQLNRGLAELAARRGVVFADIYTPLADPGGLPRADWTTDGIHLTQGAYGAIRPVIDRAIELALRTPPESGADRRSARAEMATAAAASAASD